MLPFTRQEFFEVFAANNTANWPVAVFAYLLALAALTLAWRRRPNAGRFVAMILGLMWLWVGVVYHGLYFAPINPIARFFAAAFVIEAALFVGTALGDRPLEFAPLSRLRAISVGTMVFYSLALYPAIGLAVGERYPALPLFGVTPCPLLIFTFGLMLWTKRARWWLWIIPLLWALIGGSAAVLLSVAQDWALPFFAILAVMVIKLDRLKRSTAN